MPHFPYGDGIEYIIMTESFHNHFSPEIKAEDITNYKLYLEQKGLEVHKGGILEKGFDNNGNLIWFPGYFTSTLNGQLYSYHFWLYPLICTPARAILGYFNADIRITFLATNLFFIFFGVWVISKMKVLPIIHRVFLSLFLIFSPVLWYIDWAHTEVFSGVLSFLGVLLFHCKRKYLSVFFFALASTQNPPLAIPVLLVSLFIIYEDGINSKVLIRLLIASCLVLLTPLFYWIYFDTPSMITHIGTLDTQYISLKRLFDFFFDLNQGAILGIPIALIILIAFLVKDIINRHIITSYVFLISIFLMSLIFMQVIIWNEGNAVIKRYAVWVTSMLIVVFYIRISKLKKSWFYTLATLFIISQPIVIFSQQEFNKIYWHANELNKLSKFILNNYPEFYNPDPEVFKYRAGKHQVSTTDSVITYANKQGDIVKMMIKKGSISQLIKRGIPKRKVDSLEKRLDYHNNFTYLNKKDLDLLGYNQGQDQYIKVIENDREIRLKNYFRKQIHSDPNWLNAIKKQADEWEVSLDSAIQKNVDYLYEIGEKTQ